ncbi:MAG: ABC transporter permease subunit [Anaerolineae bacterium]
MVGVRNTLTIVIAGLAGATILGILGGIFLLSGNWLIRNITRFIVEILRNTPLLVQIFAWYFVAALALPALQQAIQIPQPGLVALPLRFALYVVVALFVLRMRRERRQYLLPALVGLVAAVEVGFLYFYRTGSPDGTGSGRASAARASSGFT